MVRKEISPDISLKNLREVEKSADALIVDCFLETEGFYFNGYAIDDHDYYNPELTRFITMFWNKQIPLPLLQSKKDIWLDFRPEIKGVLFLVHYYEIIEKQGEKKICLSLIVERQGHVEDNTRGEYLENTKNLRYLAGDKKLLPLGKIYTKENIIDYNNI